LDATDVRIFCEMAFLEQNYVEFGERRPSAAKVGKKLGLDEKTVRARVGKMERSGFIKYYQAAPSLALFGMRHVSVFRFEALNLATKHALAKGLHDVPRLVESSDYLGLFIAVSIAGASQEEARKEAERLALHYELSTELLGDREVAAPPSRLDRLDWQIIKEMRYDAKASDAALAKALSVTQRVVGYRVSKLLGSGAVRIRAVIDPQRQAGLVFYELELHVHEQAQGSVSRWLDERGDGRLWNLSSPRPGVVLASLFAFTLAEPEETAAEAIRREGVKRCILFVLKEVNEPKRPNWVDSLIDLRLASDSRAPGA
jgi:DNA-binding Lrp family transcriptional regulator